MPQQHPNPIQTQIPPQTAGTGGSNTQQAAAVVEAAIGETGARASNIQVQHAPSTCEAAPSIVETVGSNIPQPEQEPHNSETVELNPADIVADPGLRKPIEQFHIDIRDAVRREYLSRGPCQPIGHKYPQKLMGNRQRSFHDSWFKMHNWLEYSIAKDAAFCFYCYLFKQPRPDNFGVDAFTSKGFTNWKHATGSFNEHVGKVDSFHNRARKHCEDFKNQRQSVSYKMDSGSKKLEQQYYGRITMILGVVRFLLLQALAFRGHDESHGSSNKGNFLEMIEWYKEKDKDAQKLLGNSPGNHLLTSPKIQKHLCKACANKTTKAILKDIGERNFAILVDESRDASIKEQMAVILRLVAVFCIFLVLIF